MGHPGKEHQGQADSGSLGLRASAPIDYIGVQEAQMTAKGSGERGVKDPTFAALRDEHGAPEHPIQTRN